MPVPMRYIGYGEEGSYTHQYFLTIRREGDTYLSCSSFDNAYDALCKGRGDALILPVNNSYAGVVPASAGVARKCRENFQRHDALSGSLFIQHALIGQEDARLEDISHVVSYPFVFSQCCENIKHHHYTCIEHVGTAAAVSDVVSGVYGKHVAAIGPAAGCASGVVLNPEFNDSPDNRTFFDVFCS